MLAKSALKYSLLLAIHPKQLFPHVRQYQPAPAEIIVDRSNNPWQARRSVILKATQLFSLILDADTTVPNEFLTRAHERLRSGYLACTLMYDMAQNHPPFGASLWQTRILQSIYDYDEYVQNYRLTMKRTVDDKGNDYYAPENPFLCECLYMYGKLKPAKLYVFPDLKAHHNKPRPSQTISIK